VLQAESVPPLLKSRPVPHVGIPFQPRLDHHTTDVVPFSFDERDKEMFARKDEKKKTVLEQEKKVSSVAECSVNSHFIVSTDTRFTS